MNEVPRDGVPEATPERTSGGVRLLSMILVLLLVSGYTLALITGAITTANRIDTTDLLLIALAAITVIALIRPDVFKHITIFELGSLKVQLQDVEEAQSHQQAALDDIRMIIAIVLPAGEQKHLVNLLLGQTANYHGGAAVRTELRHLASLSLIRRQANHNIEEMRSNPPFNMSDYVRLTEIGTRAARTISTGLTGGEDREVAEKEN